MKVQGTVRKYSIPLAPALVPLDVMKVDLSSITGSHYESTVSDPRRPSGLAMTRFRNPRLPSSGAGSQNENVNVRAAMVLVRTFLETPLTEGPCTAGPLALGRSRTAAFENLS